MSLSDNSGIAIIEVYANLAILADATLWTLLGASFVADEIFLKRCARRFIGTSPFMDVGIMKTTLY